MDSPDPSRSQAAFARLPILDARRAIVGYELVDNGQALPGDEDAAQSRDADLLFNAMALPAQASGEQRLLIVRCRLETLEGGHLDLADPQRVVIEVTLPAQADAARITAGAILLAGARQQGFRVALRHDVLASAWQSWLEQADYLMVDLSRLPVAALPSILKAAQRQAGVRLIACGIESAQQHASAADAGLQWFQGPWFTQPVWVRSQVVRPSQAVVLELIGLVRRGADLPFIEAVLKRDPALSFNLLKFINSPGFGMTREITSFAHAVMILGTDKLLRWACLLVATARDGASPAVARTAVVRGRLMELLAENLLSPDDCDHAFVAGVFSLLDAMTGVALPRALDGLPLPGPVLDVLLERSGALAPFLELTEACETADDEAFARAASQLGLSSHQINMAHLDALVWAEELMAA